MPAPTQPPSGPPTHRKIQVIACLAAGLVVASLALGLTQYMANPEASFQRGLAAIPTRDLSILHREIQTLRRFPRYEPQKQLLNGVVSLASNDLQTALRQFDLCSVHPPTRVLALTLAGETFCRMGRESEAIGVLQQALTIAPTNVDAHRWLAVAHHELGSNTEAIAELRHAIELDPADFRSQRMLGKIYKDSNQFKEAAASYRKCLEHALPKAARQNVLLELSQSLANLQQYEDALKVISLADDSADTLACRAGIQFRLGSKVAARESALKAIKLKPQHREALSWLGVLEADEGHFPQAATYLEQLLKVAPQDYAAQFKLAEIYQQLGRTEDAEEQAKQAKHTRSLREKFTKLQQQANDKPDDAEVRFQMGEVARKLKLFRVARECYQAAMSRDPKHAGAEQALKELPQPTAKSTPTDSPDTE